MDFIRLLREYSRPYRSMMAMIVVLQAASTLATLYLPSLNARIIDEGVAQGDVPFIWRTGGIMLAVAFLQVITAIIAVFFGSKTSMGTGRDIRAAVFRKVGTFSAQDVAHFDSASLITRGTNDPQQVQTSFMMALNFMVMVPIMMIGGVVMAVREDAGLSWLVAVSVAALAVAVSGISLRLMPLFQKMQKKIDRINSVLREQIAGIRVVRAFTREDYEAARFDAANTEVTELSVRIGNLFVMLFPLISLVLNVATGALLWFGGQRVNEGLVEVGSLTAFMQYLMQILMSVMMATFMVMMLPRAFVCAGRIQEVLEHEPSLPFVPTSVTSEDMGASQRAGVVEFKNVSFAYPNADVPVLKNVSFTAEPGKTTAIIGSTGSGKTTLLNLIPRLYAPTSGRVTIDSTPVMDMARADLVEYVSMVPQKPYLFSGTVATNLRLANDDATDDQLWEVLNTAQATFVREDEDGLDMNISQGGTNVSGGQRQRLCIARALLANPRIYLFDDSFSALDVVTDRRVREALKEKTDRENATVIVVAQRVSSIMDADTILVMEAGEIVGRGTHEELIHNNPTYKEIVDSQLVAANGEEVS